MSHMVCWLPWLPISDVLTVGPVTFYPLSMKSGGDALGQTDPTLVAALQKLMPRFQNIRGKSVKKLTVALMAGRTDLPVLESVALQQVEHATNLLMLSFMASNRYFAFSPYANTSMSQLVAQRFVKESEYTTIVSRRRDGTAQDGGYEHGEVIDQMPRAVHSCREATCDRGFLEAISEAVVPTTPMHRKLLLSLASFRLANSDDIQLDLLNELTLSEWAIEHFIGPCPPGKGNEWYQETVHEFLKDYVSATADSSSRQENHAPMETYPRTKWPLIRQWAWEHYRLRNDITHGNDWEAKQWRWQIAEHCLFAAWLYPLLVKLEFQREGKYRLTRHDKAALGSIDDLLADESWRQNWQQLLANKLLRIGIDESVEKFLSEHGEELQRGLDALSDVSDTDGGE